MDASFNFIFFVYTARHLSFQKKLDYPFQLMLPHPKEKRGAAIVYNNLYEPKQYFFVWNFLDQGFSTWGTLAPQGTQKVPGVCKKFQGRQIITQGYVNYDIGGMQIRKIIAWGYVKISKGMQWVRRWKRLRTPFHCLTLHQPSVSFIWETKLGSRPKYWALSYTKGEQT